MFLKVSQNSHENACARLSFLIKRPQPCNFIKKETLSQVFSCKFCETFKSIYFEEHLRMTSSVLSLANLFEGKLLKQSEWVLKNHMDFYETARHRFRIGWHISIFYDVTFWIFFFCVLQDNKILSFWLPVPILTNCKGLLY